MISFRLSMLSITPSFSAGPPLSAIQGVLAQRKSDKIALAWQWPTATYRDFLLANIAIHINNLVDGSITMDEKRGPFLGFSPEKLRSKIATKQVLARVGLILSMLGLVLWRYGSLWQETSALKTHLGGCGGMMHNEKVVIAQSWSEVSKNSHQ